MFQKILTRRFSKPTYSQCGEDLILKSLFINERKNGPGLYIDIGAYHPFKGSNTWLFYMDGWRGINIDPTPGSSVIFNKKRPEDINLEIGIAETSGSAKFYFISSDSTMNSFSKETLEKNGVLNKVTKIIDVEIMALRDIQQRYVKDSLIDFVNMDIEGLELQALKGLDFSLHRPSFFAIEQNDVSSLQDVLNSTVYEFMAERDYDVVAKNVITNTVSTIFYKNKRM